MVVDMSDRFTQRLVVRKDLSWKVTGFIRPRSSVSKRVFWNVCSVCFSFSFTSRFFE